MAQFFLCLHQLFRLLCWFYSDLSRLQRIGTTGWGSCRGLEVGNPQGLRWVSYFSVPIALSGSVVAIVLAQRAVDISKKQEFLSSMSLVDPLLNQAEQYFFKHAQNVEKVLDILFPVMKLIYDRLHHEVERRLSEEKLSALLETVLKEAYTDYANDLHAATATLKAHYRDSNRHPVLQGSFAREYALLSESGRSCTSITKRDYLKKFPNHDGGETGLAPIQRLADIIPDFNGNQFRNAVLAYATKKVRMIGFGYPFERLGRAPSEAEVAPVMQFFGVLIDDDRDLDAYSLIPFFHGAATLIDLISITPSKSVLTASIEESLLQMGVHSEAMVSYVHHRLGTYEPNLYYLPNTIRLRDAIVKYGISAGNYFENMAERSR